MKKAILFVIFTGVYSLCIAQDNDSSSEAFLKEIAESSCNCIDSIQTYNKPTAEVTAEINNCLDEATGAYQLGSKLIDVNELKEDTEKTAKKKEIKITIDVDENSNVYKKYYYEIERYLMHNCSSLRDKISDKQELSDKSLTDSEIASDSYTKGIDELKNENFEDALKYFQEAVDEDPEFAFAWDNLGLTYRKLNNFEEAIDAYEKSLEIDPNGIMPLQNIAVAYQYNGEYEKAIEAYKNLAHYDEYNPEIFYGIGQVYAVNLKNYEEGLNYICKAYNMYVAQKSPYRTDAENLINHIYAEMKKQDKEDKFYQILKNNNIISE